MWIIIWTIKIIIGVVTIREWKRMYLRNISVEQNIGIKRDGGNAMSWARTGDEGAFRKWGEEAIRVDLRTGPAEDGGERLIANDGEPSLASQQAFGADRHPECAQ